VTGASTVTTLASITPELPASRIPRTIKKITDGQPIAVVVMGSSLTESDGGTTTWPGMIFGGSSNTGDYKIPTTVTVTYAGLGGAPNQYQLAQLGFASGHTAYGFQGSGYPLSVTAKTPPNGRSSLLAGVDLVVIGCLANGGDYRLDCVEPIIRKIRAQGVEVIVVTDNAQGPASTYSAMVGAGLYVDGPTVQKVCDLYGGRAGRQRRIRVRGTPSLRDRHLLGQHPHDRREPRWPGGGPVLRARGVGAGGPVRDTGRRVRCGPSARPR
jgi:hypothetical protein